MRTAAEIEACRQELLNGTTTKGRAPYRCAHSSSRSARVRGCQTGNRSRYLYRADELGFVLADSGCRGLVTMTGFEGLNYQEMLDKIVPQRDSQDFSGRAPATDLALRQRAAVNW